jgi:hypothetical protein
MTVGDASPVPASDFLACRIGCVPGLARHVPFGEDMIERLS